MEEKAPYLYIKDLRSIKKSNLLRIITTVKNSVLNRYAILALSLLLVTGMLKRHLSWHPATFPFANFGAQSSQAAAPGAPASLGLFLLFFALLSYCAISHS